MRSNYKRLGKFIQQVSIKNNDLAVDNLLGVSITKKFIPSIANIIGTDMTTYKIIKKGQFAYGPVTSRNGDKISVALLEDHEAIISTSYTAFEIINTNELLPEYLMMWFRREEFDRYARYMSHGSTREAFGWEEMCDVELPVPSIEKQRELVKEYHTITDRIKLNEQLNQNLEDTAQSIYKEWFVNFEFPDENGKPYKSNGGEMVYYEELGIPIGWKVGKLSDIMEYSKERVTLSELNIDTYISTENMIENRGGVSKANSLPTVINVSKFTKDNILISNIRPYFKKIWLAEFNGGCSNDILCIKSKNENPLYLYFVLEQDSFFDYVMAGSKGTKMPRGDKDWILQYPIVLPSPNHLKVFSKIGNSLKTGMNLKIKTNARLVQLADILLSKMATIEG